MWITSLEAQRLLGVRRQTLYTYVSRGWIQTRALDGRRKAYRKADVIRLRDQARRRRSGRTQAAMALRWGPPILTTSISGIDRDGPYYRGTPAVDLVNGTLQDVARLLWSSPSVHLSSPQPSCTPFSLRAVRLAVDAHTDPRPSSIVHDVWSALDIPADDGLRAASILCADHGLNASTFTARVVASTGAPLRSAVVAALSAFEGPRHGAASQVIADWVDDPSGPMPPLRHALYPDGDPRTEALLPFIQLDEPSPLADLLAQRPMPNVDVALLALVRSRGLADDVAIQVFLRGRVLGWLAHAVEQAAQPGLLRPTSSFDAWEP